MKDYKKILKGVINIINTTEKSDIGFANICTYIGENYPELKENKENEETNAPTEYGKYVDECLNESAKHFFSEGVDKYSIADLFYAGIRCEKSWLEKQGEQKSTKSEKFECPNIKLNDAIEVSSRMKYIDNDLKPIAEFILEYANWDLNKDEWNQPTLTVPVFRVLDALINKGKPYCSSC